MYKDKDKQREATKEATRRYRAKKGDSALSSHKSGLENTPGLPVADELGDTHPVIPKRDTKQDIAEREYIKEAAKIHDEPERTAQGNIRVSKPGDDGYVPMCETNRAFVDGRDKRPSTAKRGKDIKSFGDLPMDVQASIDRLSVVDGKIHPTAKANRTAIAINYQNSQTDRFHSTGVN